MQAKTRSSLSDRDELASAAPAVCRPGIDLQRSSRSSQCAFSSAISESNRPNWPISMDSSVASESYAKKVVNSPEWSPKGFLPSDKYYIQPVEKISASVILCPHTRLLTRQWCFNLEIALSQCSRQLFFMIPSTTQDAMTSRCFIRSRNHRQVAA
jgi:hypothetical protein